MFEVVDKKDNLFGILDTSNGIIDYVSLKDLGDALKAGVEVKGVSINGNKVKVKTKSDNVVKLNLIDPNFSYDLIDGKVYLTGYKSGVRHVNVFNIPDGVNRISSFIMTDKGTTLKVSGGKDLENFRCYDRIHINTPTQYSIFTYVGSLDLSGLAPVKDFSYMFSGCFSLRNVDVSRLDTSDAKSFSHMFADCYRIKELDLSSFKTSNLIDMSCMFYNCGNLNEIDLSNFDMSNVKYMNGLLHDCRHLKELKMPMAV